MKHESAPAGETARTNVVTDLISLGDLLKPRRSARRRRWTKDATDRKEKQMTPTLKSRKLPLGLKPANRVVVALQRLGLAFGPMRLLSVPGRKSGRIQTTPISPL